MIFLFSLVDFFRFPTVNFPGRVNLSTFVACAW